MLLIRLLCAARMIRFDLLQPVRSLARQVPRWNRACCDKLFRLVCYISPTLNINLMSHIGDPIHGCRLLLTPVRTSPVTPEHQTRLQYCFWLWLDPAHVLRLQWRPKDKPQPARAPQAPESPPRSILFQSKGYQCPTYGIRSSHCAPLPGGGRSRCRR